MRDLLALATFGVLLVIWWLLFERKPKIEKHQLSGERKYMAMSIRRVK